MPMSLTNWIKSLMPQMKQLTEAETELERLQKEADTLGTKSQRIESERHRGNQTQRGL